MAEIKSVKIVVEVIVKESDDYYFKLDDYDKNGIASVVEDKLLDIRIERGKDWEVLGAQVKKIK